MNKSVTSGSGCGTGGKFREPYRATKLWLEAVAIFRRGVPLAKHRRQWRTFDNCFSAQEAIGWFQSQLQIAFDPSISRKQTLTLLQKFYKANIFVETSKSSVGNSPAVINETDFKDNGHLYRLVCQEPRTTTKAAGSKISSSNLESSVKLPSMPKSTSNYSVLIKPLSAEEINQIWEQSFINKFVQIVGYDVFTSFFKTGLINGSSISYNLTQLGPHNIVVLTAAQKIDDLPHWLVSAMKCLANWPNNHTQESGIPNYPGFESDVYKLISDYFMSFKDKSPLLTYELYDAFITTFIRAELFDFNSRLYSAKISNASRSRIFQQMMMITPKGDNIASSHFASQSPMFKLEDQYPFNASESVENLIIDILTPANNSAKNRTSSVVNARKNLFNPRQGRTTAVFKDLGQVSTLASSSSTIPRNLRFSNRDCREIAVTSAPHLSDAKSSSASVSSLLQLPNPMPPQSYHVDRYTNPMFYETAFTGNSPITRVVSHTELKASLGSKTLNHPTRAGRGKVRPPAHSADAILDTSNYSNAYAYENPFLELSASDLINHPKYSKIRESSDLQVKINQSTTEHNLSSNSFWNDTNNSSGGSGYETGPSSTKSTSTLGNPSGSCTMLDDKFMVKPMRTVSAINLSDAVKDRHPYTGGGAARKIYGQSLASHYANSPSKTVRRMLEFYYGADACVPGLMTTEGKQLAIMSFRLLTLLLPPVNRRHLQILLRFMSKTSRNDKLMLDVASSTRAIIINTFFRCVLRSEDLEEYDELLALRIVTFLMDNDHEIFSVAEDNDIVTVAKEEISRQQVIKVPTDTVTTTSTAAERIEVQQQEVTVDDNGKGLDNSINDQYVYAEANKENNLQFCSRITMDEYEDQRLLSGTSLSLRQLLDTLVNNDKLGDKEKRKQILKFKDEYPHIFQEKFGDDEWPSFLNDSSAKGKREKRKWNLFKALRL